MAAISCPSCQSALNNDPSLAGQVVNCPYCNQPFVMPTMAAAPIPMAQFQSPTAPNAQNAKQWIVTPVLISGIVNAFTGIVWLCLMPPIGAAMIALSVFEFLHFSKAGRMTPIACANNAFIIGIFEIIAGLFNLVSLPCGIIVVIYASGIKKSATPVPPAVFVFQQGPPTGIPAPPHHQPPPL